LRLIFLGGEVQARIKLVDELKSKPIEGFVNIFARDIKPFLELEDKKYPPSLPTMILLENEISKSNKEREFYYANEYIDNFYTSKQNQDFSKSAIEQSMLK
jgi:hypothetical protein